MAEGPGLEHPMRADHQAAAGSFRKQITGKSSTIPHAVGMNDVDAGKWYRLHMPQQGERASRARAARRRHIHAIPAMAIHWPGIFFPRHPKHLHLETVFGRQPCGDAADSLIDPCSRWRKRSRDMNDTDHF